MHVLYSLFTINNTICSFVHSLYYSFNIYLLCTYGVPDTLSIVWDTHSEQHGTNIEIVHHNSQISKLKISEHLEHFYLELLTAIYHVSLDYVYSSPLQFV